ncbi:MAG: hypothetical protein KDA88_08055 [Planctomycetaceae bacterium]|nr:hypothetical protein [Planctomycetaceae bacterium]MCB9953641.1 hypothetical protein [Planctomycetaceae bacterium]
MLYIIGCGRSGTKYTTAVLRELGLDVGHESLEKDGEIGWKGLIKILDSRVSTEGLTILHQVRNPLETISSLRTHTKGLLKNVSRHFPTKSRLNTAEGKLWRCMEYWYHWNLLAEQYACWTFRIEAFDELAEQFFERAGLPPTSKTPTIDRSLNSRRTPRFASLQQEPVSWRRLREIDDELCTKIRDLALRYGYSEEFLADEFQIDVSANLSQPNPSVPDSKAKKIYIAPYLLEMQQVRSITRQICDSAEFFADNSQEHSEESWTLAWGYPATKRRFGVAETGFFWDAMHIDTQGLYQFSSLNSAEGVRAIQEFSAPEPASSLIARAPLPKSKYRQPDDEVDWNGVVFACQNPADRSVHSVASTEDWWRFLKKCCAYYGDKLFVKLHPWNRNEIEARIREVAKPHGCQIGRAGHTILNNCEHAVMFNSTYSVDCMVRGVPVKQGAPGYFSGTGAVTLCHGDPARPIGDTVTPGHKLVDFLAWRYCFSMDCSLDDWRRRLRIFANASTLFPLPLEESYGAYLQSKCPEPKIELPNAEVNTRACRVAHNGDPANDNLVIPRRFHIIWIGGNPIPEDHQKWLDGWNKLHPNWETTIWGDEVIDEMSETLRNMYVKANSWSGKSDIARVAVVHKYGGVYHDTDYRPLRCIEPILQGCRAFAITERPNGRLTGSLFGATANHPFLNDLIEAMPRHFDPVRPMKAGPLLFDAVFKRGRADVRLFEREAFAPVMSNKKRQARKGKFPHSFAVHTYAGSWTKPRKPEGEQT